MNVSFKKKADPEDQNNRAAFGSRNSPDAIIFVVQFYLFYQDGYLGWDCFDQKQISVGKSQKADLVLDDNAISDIQAVFYIKGDRIIVSDKGVEGALKRNNKSVKNSIIGPLDFITIGEYTLKIKLKSISNKHFDQASHIPRNSRLVENFAVDPEKLPLAHNRGLDDSKPTVKKVVKSSKFTALSKRIDSVSTFITSSEIIKIQPGDSVETSGQSGETGKGVASPVLSSDKKNSFPPSFFTSVYDVEDMENEEEDLPASFSLREKMLKKKICITSGKTHLEVVKFKDSTIKFVEHLSQLNTLSIIDEYKHDDTGFRKVFCSIKKRHDKSYLYFSASLVGKINVCNGEIMDTEKVISLQGFLSRQSTFRSIIPEGESHLSYGCHDFVLRPVSHADEGPAHENRLSFKSSFEKQERELLKRNLAKFLSWSLFINAFLVMALSLFFSMPTKQPFTQLENRFVVIDTKNIHKPEKPKKTVIPVRPKRKEVKAVTPKSFRRENRTVAIRKKRMNKTSVSKAGGGNKGNITNRNINKVGLLGALGTATGVKTNSSQALADVTNIDAVTSTHTQEAQVKMGGLVGNLGTDGIAMPSGKVVNTKGSASVFRSAGISGKGSVAALESGNTGKGAVRGVVSAPLTKKVRMKGGGISRADVEKVIHQHIGEVNYCYETALLKDPTLMGKVVFEWKILLSGNVGEVKIKSSTVRSSEIHSCIKSAIRTWKFPNPKGQTVLVSYPFVFDISGF